MDSLTAGAGLPNLSDYSDFVRRHRAVIALMTGAGLLVGLAWSFAQPSTFSATASVALTPVPVYVIPSTAGLLPPEVSIDTDAQLLQSPRVLAAIGNALGEDAQTVQRRVSVTASPNSHVLHVTVSAGSPQQAADAAEAGVTALVDVRRDALGALRSGQLRQLRLFVTDQEALLAREQSRRLVIPSLDDLFAQTLELRAGLAELEEARQTPAQVVRPAAAPVRADHSNAEVPITSGAMVGLLGGCLLGAGRDRARRRHHQRLNAGRIEDHHEA